MSKQQHYTPPRWASVLLNWLLTDVWETGAGDYEEYYNQLAATHGERHARWWYRGQVLRLLPDRLYEKAYWGALMLKNYVVLGIRTLRTNKVASVINIAGLSAAVGIAVVIFLFTQEINTFDDFHEQGDRVFLVGHAIEHEGGEQLWGTSPVPLGPALSADWPQVEQAVRYAEEQALVQTEGHAFRETVSFADPGFFDVLTFPLADGDAAALADPGAVILSSRMASKYFSDRDPLGEVLTVTFGTGAIQSFIIRGVAQPFPPRSSLTFDVLVGYETLLGAAGTHAEDWAALTDGTFLKLKRAEDQAFVADQLSRYLPAQQAADVSQPVQAYFLDNIARPDLRRAWDIHDRALMAPPFWETVGVGLIGLLVLLIACFNYITIALGSAARRLKEIGVRKTTGAEQRHLVVQFLTENLLLCGVALIGGLFIAWAVVIPYMHHLTSMQLHLDLLGNQGLWLFLVGLLAFIGVVSGAYPAFYIASFQPAEILRGTLKLAEKKGLTRALTTVQFVLTIITISLSLFLVSLDDALTGTDWGYADAQTLVIPEASVDQYNRLRQDGLQLAQVVQVVGAQHHVGASLNTASIVVDGTEKQVLHYAVGPSYFEVLGLRMAAGRPFDPEDSADSATGVVINETLAQQEGWADPIGQPIRLGDDTFSVMGVVEDFLVHPLAGKAHPVVFGLTPPAQYRFVMVRVGDGAIPQVTAALQSIWDQHFPEIPFDIYPQREVFGEYDLVLELSLQFTRYLGLFALLISCMGLFGMASQRAARRIKEVGIRKAMGASATQVALLVNRSFLVMLAISTLIATPLCYAGLRFLLSFAPVDIPLSTTPFVLTNVLVFLLAAVSLSLQTTRLVRVNSADVLRYN
ncbi:MAG: ABC transporter permease [Bacteroidota bacterium]